MSEFDELTKFFNKKHFDIIIQKKISNILHNGGDLSLVFLDIDYFNNYIESYGISESNDCVYSISKFIHNYFHHNGDLIFRYGTSKFALLLSDTKLDDIINIVDKIRLSIHSSKIPYDASPIKYITISGGITIIDGHDASYLANPVSELIRLADTALKDAKKCGMDRIKIRYEKFCTIQK